MDSVLVNGVSLTRKQIEQALVELNTVVFAGGDIVVRKDNPHGSPLVVLAGRSFRRIFNGEYSMNQQVDDRLFLRTTDGHATYSKPASHYLRIGRLEDIRKQVA